LFLDFNAAAEADLVEFFIGKVFDLFEPKSHILVTELLEEHVELAGNDLAREVFENAVDLNLFASQFNDVVNCVHASYRIDSHKMGHVH
jgi:hypothetical protein